MPDAVRIDDIPASLIRRAQAGEPTARETLLGRLYPLVFRWALVRMGYPDEADDVTQEAMIRIDRALDGFEGRSALTTWAYQIVANAATDHRRRGKRHDAAVPLTDTMRAAGPTDAESALDRAATRELISTFFADLSPQQRQVFDLVDLQGFKAAEVADMTGLAAATVRVHLARARRAIRERILHLKPELLEGI